jgi:uncharacterized protein YecE (DUF72 family)
MDRLQTSVPPAAEPSEAQPGHLLIGTAGWVVPKGAADSFPGEGSHLQRYASRFGAAEINSSFHRPHRRTTYERWAASVPQTFRFSVKLPKTLTHAPFPEHQKELIERFAGEVQGLGDKLGIVLVQFPPKRQFDTAAMDTLFSRLQAVFACPIVCEPRHPSWFTPEADEFLIRRTIARVAADPAPVPQGREPGGLPSLRYYRLHGSPVIYRSSYGNDTLANFSDSLTAQAAAAGAEIWCIFDNTASSAAAGNALTLLDLAQQSGS